MRFIVLSDIHGRADATDWIRQLVSENSADALLVLGDISHFGPLTYIEGFLTNLNLPVYAIPGNCDPPGTLEVIRRTATALHLTRIDISERVFVGVGGSNPTIFDTPFELSEDELDASLEPLMEGVDILITHAPPYGINDTTPSGQHVGSTALRRLVDLYRPELVLSGHIHEARGIVEVGGIKYMNPGAARDGLAGLMDIDDDIHLKLLESHQ